MRKHPQDQEPMRTLTVEDVAANPRKFGFPTFEEYCMMRQKYVGREDDLLSAVDAGGTMLKNGNYVRKIRYQFGRWETDKLEQLESIALNEGVALNELEIMSNCIVESSTSCTILVEFMSKSEFQRRRILEKQDAARRPGKVY